MNLWGYCMSTVRDELRALPPDGRQLRAYILDLMSLSAVSSGWIGSDAAPIAERLAAVLQSGLQASFVYVQVRTSLGDGFVEAMQTDPRHQSTELRMGLDQLRLLAFRCSESAGSQPVETDDNGTKLLAHPIGDRGDFGTVIAGCGDPGFPSYSGKLFLNLAITQTCLALQTRRLHQKERAARIEAERAQERISRVLESTTDAFIAVDSEWNVVYLNAEGERLMQKSREELIGKNLWVEFPEATATNLRFFQSMTHALKEQRRVDFEEFYPPLGLWIEVHLYSSPEGASIYFRDVTQRKRSEAAIRESEARFRQLADSMPQIVWTATPDGAVDYLNQRWYEYTGFPEGGGWSDRFLTAIHPEDEKKTLGKWHKAVESGELFETECRLMERRNGSYRWHLVRAVPVCDVDGAILRWFGTSTDVNSQKQTEEELEAARMAAESASRAKSSFLARMSHELRTPLNSVIGFSDVLLKNRAGNLTASDLDSLQRIASNGRHLLGLINEVLDHSKIESGRVDVEWGVISLRHLILEVTGQMNGGLAKSRSVSLQTELPDNMGSLETDRGKLKQVLINLVANALKFTERGFVTVRAVADKATQDPVRIEVIDTGIGIPLERLEAIFDPFEQAHRRTSLEYGGTGLGLSISRSYCQLMGYALTVESEPGKGSVFTILLTAKNAAHSKAS